MVLGWLSNLARHEHASGALICNEAGFPIQRRDPHHFPMEVLHLTHSGQLAGLLVLER
jgi:hypothetical protein